MKKIEYKITDDAGLHARPAGILVKESRKFESSITANNGDKSADCKKLFSLMELMAKTGDIITITISGADEQLATTELATFLEENL